jgi:NADH-dependent peroxiredoxin subunit C
MSEQKCDCSCCVHPVGIGAQVPNVSFEYYQAGKTARMSLEDFKGKWLVLFFYPADFTFVCPTELEDMADHYEEFKKQSAEIVSVSTDTVFVHKAWHDTSKAVGKIQFPMAADPQHRLSHLFGVHIEDEGVALRGSFIIDPEGKLKIIEINDNGIGRNAKELLRKLQAAKFVHEHGDKVCPANWNPGDDTLEPGMDLVGKI